MFTTVTILIAAIYLIALSAMMRTEGLLNALFFKALPLILGIIIGLHALGNLGISL